MIVTAPDGFVLAYRSGATRVVRTRIGLHAALESAGRGRIVGFWRVWLNRGRG